mgnify:CR=1 FL=1
MELSFEEFVKGVPTTSDFTPIKEKEEPVQDLQPKPALDQKTDFLTFTQPKSTSAITPEVQEQQFPEQTPDIDPELREKLDQAYERTVEYFGGYYNVDQVTSIQEVMAEQRAEEEAILNKFIKGQGISREEGLDLIRKRNPDSILLKTDTDAAMESLNSFAGESPEKQRETMLANLQSENAMTRRVAETALRNMDDSILGAMNGVVLADSVINPITIGHDVPIFMSDAVESGQEAYLAAKEGRYKDAAKAAGMTGVNTAFGFLSAAEAIVPFVYGGTKLLKGAKGLARTPEEHLALARKYNYGGAKIATMEAAEEARELADFVVKNNQDMVEDFIDAIDRKWNTSISTVKEGKRVVDFDKAKKLGQEIAEEITERDGALFDLNLGDDVITSPLLNPNKFNPLVAAAVDLKDAHPEYFGKADTVIEDLFNLTTRGDLRLTDEFAEEFIDTLNKYGLSFEDYVLVAAGTASKAGTVLQKFSQIVRSKPASIRNSDIEKRKAREAGDFRRGVMRVENARRGGLVSQIATAARNLSSGAIRVPMEGLGNVMDTAIYTAQNKGVSKGVGEIFSGENWKGSFSNWKYAFARPDVAKGYTDLILERPELAKQFDTMFNNINEIQKLTGRGTGTKFDKVMSVAEDVVDTLNTPNRWQEFLIRRGQFFGELERLTKREYNADLLDMLNEGKLKDLLNDASSVRPKGAPSFTDLIDRSIYRAMDVTYAKQPDVPVFRSVSSFITRNGLTVIVPFPRFMFNSMELMAQYGAGSSLPLTRKIMSVVKKDIRGPMTDFERQAVTRNLMGIAAVGAAYMYRTSDDVSPDSEMITVGEKAQIDTTATYPLAQILWAGDATKHLVRGTFDNWFNARNFADLFVGVNLRTGVGNSIIEEMAQIAGGVDLTKGERAGKALGRTLGNYLTTWMVPFAQIIDAQRATGKRGTEYADVARDPKLNFAHSFVDNVRRSVQSRGFFLSAEEEAKLPRRSEAFYPDGKERLSPILKFAGVTMTNRPPEDAEYLMELGFDWREFGSKSKVPSIKSFEQNMINGYIELLAKGARQEGKRRHREYLRADKSVREEFTRQQFINNHVRLYVSESLKAFKQKIKDGAIAQGDKYARAMTKYRRIDPKARSLATVRFVEMYGKRRRDMGKDPMPDPMNAEDLQTLVEIARKLKEAY